MRLLFLFGMINLCCSLAYGQSKDDSRIALAERRLTGDMVEADLNHFERILDNQWLLARLNNTDFKSAIEAVRQQLRDGATVGELAVELQRILSLGADGHAGTLFHSELMRRSPNFPPFTIIPVGNRYVAVNPSERRRRQLFRPSYPYVVEIDGIPIDQWIEAAMPFVPQSHPLAMRAKAADYLRLAGGFRKQMGIPDVPEFALRLESRNGERRIQKFTAINVVPSNGALYLRYRKYLAREASTLSDTEFSKGDYGYWRVTEENIGYIQLDRLGGPTALHRTQAMSHMKKTDGLVLDLRGNLGGHTWEMLNIWGLWFIDPESHRHVPFVVRRWDDHESPRFTPSYHALSPELSTVGRTFIANALTRFHSRCAFPEHRPTRDWAALIADPDDEPLVNSYPHLPDEVRTALYYYDRPVIILCDRYTFSAPEIIAAGLRSLPNVRILGEPTAGGGGSVVNHELPSGQIVTIASTNVVLQLDGVPIDGQGVQPDIRVDLDLDTLAGNRDTLLDHAVEQLSNPPKDQQSQ